MSEADNLPVISQQTLAQNEAVETVLLRFSTGEVLIPPYQRDADQWDEIKKSLFIESVLNRLTVPAFYLAPNEQDEQIADVIDGQQRLTTLQAFSNGTLRLSGSDACPYFGNSSHYAGHTFEELTEIWKRAFRRYNLTLVTLPPKIDLSLRLEIFRRINEGGTPLSGQDIRLSYYSESPCVRYIQAVGIFDPQRPGSERMLKSASFVWPWETDTGRSVLWREWWEGRDAAIGQTASEMFLWYLAGSYRKQLDALLADHHALNRLKIRFRGNTDEVLDCLCAQFKQEDLHPTVPRLFPTIETLQSHDFPTFARWWQAIRNQCGPNANVAKQRSIALLISALERVFGQVSPSPSQWGYIGRFLKATRDTAKSVFQMEFPEPKGKWASQRKQLDAYDTVAERIKAL